MKLFISLIVLLSALSIATVAGWFSIIGLMAIFSGLPEYAMIMAIVLEIGKVSAATWLKTDPAGTKAFRTAGVSLVIVLMLITSIGIFGLLSKAHVEQGAPVANNAAKIERIEQRISTEENSIIDVNKIINQLDNSVDTLIEYDRIRGPDGAIAVREEQKDQRESLSKQINDSNTNIDTLLDQKFELEQTVREYEVEVGPIKYIAALIVSNPSASTLESAVRILILMLIFVFDPLAIWLLLAANQSFMDINKNSQQIKKKINRTTTPKEDNVMGDEIEVNEITEVESSPEAFEEFVEQSETLTESKKEKKEKKERDPKPAKSKGLDKWLEDEGSELLRCGHGPKKVLHSAGQAAGKSEADITAALQGFGSLEDKVASLF